MHYKVVVIAEAEEDLNRFIQWPVKKYCLMLLEEGIRTGVLKIK